MLHRIAVLGVRPPVLYRVTVLVFLIDFDRFLSGICEE